MAGRSLASTALLLVVRLVPVWCAGPLSVDALVGWNGVVREGRAAPLVLSVENDGGAVDCTVSIDVAEGSGASGARSSLVLSQPAAIPAHSSRRLPFVLPPLSTQRSLTLRVTVQGREAARARVELEGMQRDAIVVALSGGMSLDFLSGLSEELRVVYPHVENLPVSWAGYDGVERVVVHDLAFEDLSARQASALRGWIASGGTLVVSGGPAALRLPGSSLDPLLPVEVTGLAEARVLSGLAGVAAGSPLPRGPFVVARSRLRSGTLVAQQGGAPLIAVRKIGHGSVYFLSFDCALEPLVSWPGNAALWRILAGGETRPPDRIETRDPVDDPWLKGASEPAVFTFPRPAALVAFLGGFLAALLPVVNLWVGRRMASLARAAVLAGVALAASGCALFLFTRTLFSPDAILLEASAAETVSGSGLARVTERLGVFATEARTVDLRFAARGVLVRESPARGSAPSARRLEVLTGEDTVLAGVVLRRFGSRLFQLQAMRDLDVRFEARGPARSPLVAMENRSPFALTGCFLSFEGALYPLPDLPPGARVEASAVSAASPAAAIPDPARLAFWELAGSTGSEGAPVLYAWLEQPLVPMEPPPGTRRAAGQRLHLLAVEAL